MGRPKKLSTVLKTGDRLASLEAMRDHLAKALEEADVAVKAQIAGQLRQVLAEIDGAVVPEGSGLDDLRERRAKRLRGPGTDSSAGSAGGS